MWLPRLICTSFQSEEWQATGRTSSPVYCPAVVPHAGVHYAEGRWVHVTVSLEMGGRTLHVSNQTEC
eukprot:4492456-Amphidinium_carterae.1